VKRILPSQRMEQEFFQLLHHSPASEAAAHPLSEAVRLGAQLMLQRALEQEVTGFLGRGHYQRSPDGPVRGYRSGYEPKRVQSAEGTLVLEVPQVRDTLEEFESLWLRALLRRSEKLTALIPQLYVKGLSTRDIEAALEQTLAVDGISRSSVSAVCGRLKTDFSRWQGRDLSGHRILYLFVDGHYLRLRAEDDTAIAVLCAYGIEENGQKVLLHLAVGDRESKSCWKSFFQDMKTRGLADPLLAVLDGNAGLRSALRECWPQALVQRCQVHKMRNILCKLPERARAGIKKLIQKAFTAKTLAEGLEQARGIVAMYQDDYPEAMKCLAADLEECLTVLRLPEAHRKRVRTTNLLERLFGEGRRRSKVIPRFIQESSGMSLVFAVLTDASAHWHGVRINAALLAQIKSLNPSIQEEQAVTKAA
jgi:putative transposase